jgi:hypothetical protein
MAFPWSIRAPTGHTFEAELFPKTTNSEPYRPRIHSGLELPITLVKFLPSRRADGSRDISRLDCHIALVSEVETIFLRQDGKP